MPGEYPLLGHPDGPEDWKVTDVISIASLVAGIFGKGGGGEVSSALVLEEARSGSASGPGKRSGRTSAAPTTPRRRPRSAARRFPYMPVPKRAKPALPDPGTTEAAEVVAATTASARPQSGRRAASCPTSATCSGSLREMDGASNALLVSRREAKGGRPLAVFGPQVSYYTPQILIELEIHAPGGPRGRRSTLAARRSPEPTSTSSSATAATTPGRRPRRARTSSTPSRSSSARPTDRRRRWTR